MGIQSLKNMQLPANIWYAYRRLHEIDIDAAGDWLSDEEHAFLDTVGSGKRRVEYTAGRILARTLAANILRLTPDRIQIRVADDGALELTGTPYAINVAHTREGACAALARDTSVGIDLETIKVRHADLYTSILNEHEYHLLDTLPTDRDHAVILCWVLKEATLKGMRTGLRCSPKSLHLHIDPDTCTARIVTAEQQQWHAHYKLHDNAYLAVAYPSP